VPGGKARIGQLGERLKAYLHDGEPLALDGLEFGFFPTKGRYDAAAMLRAATDAGVDPWSLLAADSRTLTTFLKRRPDAEQRLASVWTASPPWFGHRKTKTVRRGATPPIASTPPTTWRRKPSRSRATHNTPR
jgi:hypothetical protein